VRGWNGRLLGGGWQASTTASSTRRRGARHYHIHPPPHWRSLTLPPSHSPLSLSPAALLHDVLGKTALVEAQLRPMLQHGGVAELV
jgi:hypothetical protein